MASRFYKMLEAVHKDYNTSWLSNSSFVLGENNPEIETYAKSDIVYVCISTNSKAISQVPLKVYDGERFIEEHPWNARLKRPNYLHNQRKFIEAICVHLQLEGEIFCTPFPFDYSAAVPESLFLIPFSNIQERKNESGGLEGWKYTASGIDDINLELGQVCHIWFYNPYNPFRGISPLKAGKISVATDYKAAKYNQIFFDKGALNSGLITTDQSLSPTQMDDVQKRISAKFNTGNTGAHQIAVLQKGLGYQSLSASHREMEFSVLKDKTRESIMQIFGVRKSIISETQNINKAVSQTEKENWWEATLLPIMRMIEEAFTFTFFGLDSRVSFKFDTSGVEALQKNFAEQVKIGLDLQKLHFNSNEINERLNLGFDTAPHRDYIYLPMGVTPIGPGMGVDTLVYSPEPVIEEEPLQEPEQIEENIIDITPKRIAYQIGRQQIEQKGNQRLDHLWKTIVKSTKPLENKFQDKTRIAFYQMRQRVLRWVYDQKKAPFVLNDKLSDIENLLARPMAQLKKDADALYEQSLMEGLKTLAAEIGIAPDLDLLSRPDVIQYLKRKVAKLSQVGDTINNQVTNVIANAIDNEVEFDEVVNQIKLRFNFARSRAKTVARTEVFGAVNHGRQVLMENSNFRRKKWFTALDEQVREAHGNAHGQVKRIKEPFEVGGEPLMHPGDPNASGGNIINCRCIHTVEI